MRDVCACGGNLRLDTRVHLPTGAAFDHYTCMKCKKIVLRHVVEAPETLEGAIRRGYEQT